MGNYCSLKTCNDILFNKLNFFENNYFINSLDSIWSRPPIRNRYIIVKNDIKNRDISISKYGSYK